MPDKSAQTILYQPGIAEPMRIIIQGIVQGVGFRRNFFFLTLAVLGYPPKRIRSLTRKTRVTLLARLSLALMKHQANCHLFSPINTPFFVPNAL
jgi:hypothetical protein